MSTRGGRFCPPLQRSHLNFPCGYVPVSYWILNKNKFVNKEKKFTHLLQVSLVQKWFPPVVVQRREKYFSAVCRYFNEHQAVFCTLLFTAFKAVLERENSNMCAILGKQHEQHPLVSWPGELGGLKGILSPMFAKLEANPALLPYFLI